MNVSSYDLASRFLGTKEAEGSVSNPQVLAMLRLDVPGTVDDETPWCSAFVNYISWLLRLPRSKSLSARSWLSVGVPVRLEDALPQNDIVVLSRGSNPAYGHVGFFSGTSFDPKEGTQIHILGGNQNDSVSVSPFPKSRLLGIRRLAP